MSGPSETGPAQSPSITEVRQQRAALACTRCRRRKLRCTGGYPCSRCTTAGDVCDFHDERFPFAQAAGPESSIRIAQLEKTVETLLSDLAAIRPRAEETAVALPAQPTALVDVGSADRVVRFDVQSAIEPSRLPIGAHSWSKESAEGRLAVASQTGDTYSAPFQPLTYRPKLWENREPSRQTSPQPGAPSRDESWPAFEGKAGPKDDPLTNGLICETLALNIFELFINSCHPFLPIVRFFRQDLSPFREVRQRSSYLFTVILAIGARFYRKWQALYASQLLQLFPGQADQISRLAYSHLAASMFRKQHQLADVQATLLLAAWGLEGGGGGPDPWMVTGHVGRLCHRLGLNRVPLAFQETEKDEARRSRRLASWRTWLAWIAFDGFLSLGFGRPPSHCVEGSQEELFLQSSIAVDRPNDIYVTALLQLSKIGRELVHWSQGLCTVAGCSHSVERPVGSMRHKSLPDCLRDLNAKLDVWKNRWTWIASSQTVHLGAFRVGLLKLQCEHVRLCLNSLALKPTQTPDIASYVKLAMESAINIIQAHSESQGKDHALSFCFDYITIALGQAAIFLIRLHTARDVLDIDPGVIQHFLQLATDVLATTDLSETKNSTFLARICRDLAGAAGIALAPRTEQSPLDLETWTTNNPTLLNNPDDVLNFLHLDNLDGFQFGMPTEPVDWGSFGFDDN